MDQLVTLRTLSPHDLELVKKNGRDFVKNLSYEKKESDKAAKEKRWEDYWEYNVNYDEYRKRKEQIEKNSINVYEGIAKTKAQQKFLDKSSKLFDKYMNDPNLRSNMWKPNSEYRKEREVIYDEIMSNVLKDIGLPNTKDNREKYKPIVFWD